MRKHKLYIILAVLTIIFLFGTAAICSQCSQNGEPPSTEPVVTPSEEEPPEEPPPVEKSSPTIKLNILEGYPKYLEESGICYYRVEAEVTGSPTPDVVFSQDDSGGSWGDYIAQVNIDSVDEVIVLTATATNAEGSDDKSIELSWGCDEEPPSGGEPPDDEGVVFKSPDEEIIFTPTEMTLNPSDIGYLVFPSGVNTETAIIGDSVSNTEVRGYFGFDNLSSIAGREIESVTLRLDTSDTLDHPDPALLPYIAVYLERDREIFPLDSDYWDCVMEGSKTFNYGDEPLIWSNNFLKDAIKERADEDRRAEFCIVYYPFVEADGDNKIDGREFTKEDIRLIIEFAD